MRTSAGRVVLLIVSTLLVFGSVAAILLQVLPGPHQPSDYLVIGAVATLASMLTLFVVLITAWFRTPNVFFKRRKVHGPGQAGGDEGQ